MNSSAQPVLHEHTANFEAFYKQGYGAVVGFLLRLGASRAEAEDATQCAMLELMAKWPQVRQPAPWVRVVAKNKWLRSLNSSVVAVPSGSATDVADVTSARAQRGDPARSHSLMLEHEAAVDLVSRLPRAQREAFALTLEGLGPMEIARLTGRPVESIRSNLAHARRRLRNELAPALQPGPI